MIRVAKSETIPAELINKGIPATAENCRLYDADPAGYDAGTSTLTINPDIYGHKTVKRQLTSEQHGKYPIPSPL